MKTRTSVPWKCLWAGAVATTSFSMFQNEGDSGGLQERPSPTRPLVSNGEEVEIVGEYKHLGSIIDCKLDCSPNALALLKKGNQRLYFMKKLKSFSVCPKLLELFYKSTVESVVTFNSLCHFGGLKEEDKARLSKITKTASRLIGRLVPDLQAHFEANQ